MHFEDVMYTFLYLDFGAFCFYRAQENGNARPHYNLN
jgi:hypothetical protein